VVGPGVAAAQAQWSELLDGSSVPMPPWAPDGSGGSAAVTDLGGGNSGIAYADTGASYFEHYLTHYEPASTFAARFRIDTFDADKPHNLMLLTAANPSGNAPGLAFGIRNGQFALGRFFPSQDEGMLLSNIAPVTPGAFNTVALYVDSATDTATLWWNGAILYNQAGLAGGWGGAEGYAEVGSAGWNPDDSGALTVTYDWIAFGPGAIPEPATLSLAALGAFAMMRRRRR
jgi:hypothetical protein